MKVCEHCGASQGDEARFCDVCGTPFPEESKSVTLPLMQAVIAYQAGDNQAFQTIYDETEKLIYTSIQKVVGNYVNAPAIIADIMQATYLEISRALGQLERPEKFVSWASSIAIRNCFAYLNANQPNANWYEVPYGYAEQPIGDYIIPSNVNDDVTMQNRIREIIEQSFTSMEKLCVVSHYYNQVPVEEMSQSLGISSHIIEKNLNSAKTKLCNTLAYENGTQTTNYEEATPWLSFLFKQDVDANIVPNTLHDVIVKSISGIALGVPGAITSGIVVTGAAQATGSIAVGGGLSSGAMNAFGAFAGGAGTMGNAAMSGGQAMGSAAMSGGQVMGGAASVGANTAVGTSSTAFGVTSSATTGTAGAGAAASATTSTAVGTASATTGAAAGGVTTGILSTVGAKVALAVAGTALVAGGTVVVHHVVTNDDKDEEQPSAIEEVLSDEDDGLYRIMYDSDRELYPWVADNYFGTITIEGNKYQLLAKTVDEELAKFKATVEAEIPQQNQWAQGMQLGEDAEYCVNFKIARADERIFSCLSKEIWNTYTDATWWSPFVTIDAQTGEVLDIDDVCDVTDLMEQVDKGIDVVIPQIKEQYPDYYYDTPESCKEQLRTHLQSFDLRWFLSTEGVCVYIPTGYPAGAGCWTLLIPYENLSSFDKDYLPAEVISGDLTCDIGIMLAPSELYVDTNGDGTKEKFGSDWTDFTNNYREAINGHGYYYVRNQQNQNFLIAPYPSEEGDGTRIYLLEDGLEREVTNSLAFDLNVCSISGDIAYCYNLENYGYAYYQITDQGLVPWDPEVKKHTYEFFEENVSWSEAKERCEQMGGHLATVTSSAEQAYLESIAEGRRGWIGGFCDENYENWQWVTGETWNYENWEVGEPSHHGVLDNEYYLALWPRKWNDLGDESNEREGFICEWDYRKE